jgi:hypothetical protein
LKYSSKTCFSADDDLTEYKNNGLRILSVSRLFVGYKYNNIFNSATEIIAQVIKGYRAERFIKLEAVNQTAAYAEILYQFICGYVFLF